MGSGPKTTQQTQGQQTQQQQQKVDPWSGQQPYLLDAFQKAQGLSGSGTKYTGDFIASPTDQQVGAFQNALTSSQGGLSAANSQIGIGQNLAQTGTQGAQQALGGLFQTANSNPTSQIVADAGKMADNPFIEGMVGAAMRDVNRNANEVVLPGITQTAAATGNLNSNRRSISEGIVQRGLNDQAGDISAGLRGQAYSQGLNLAAGNQDRMLEALRGAGGLAGGMAGTGLGGMQGGVQSGLDATNQANLASANLSTFNQAPIDNAVMKSDYANNFDWNNLSKYYGIIGGNSWGSNSAGSMSGTNNNTGTSQTTPSTMQNLGMMSSIMGSLFRSDARTKNIIAEVGKTKEGLSLYKYTYKDDPEERIYTAPLAQDVQKLNPEAVIEINGVLYIDTLKYDWR